MTKKIGFLSFGHYRDIPGARVQSAGDALRDAVEMAVAAEDAGFDGAWVRVHHFDQSLAAPFPLLSAMAARTHRIDLGTGVIDLRYENPLYMAGEAAASDLLSDGRLQLGMSRGSPEPAADGQAAYGYFLDAGRTWAEETRSRAALFREAIRGVPMARSHRAIAAGDDPDLPVTPQSPGLINRIWWGAASMETGLWTADQGMNLLSSTVMFVNDDRPFHVQQADQVRAYRDRYHASGHTTGGMAAVTRSVFPLVTDADHRYFGRAGTDSDQTGILEGRDVRGTPVFVGEPDNVADMLQADEAVNEADYVLFTLPSHIGVDHNARIMRNIAAVTRSLGWTAPTFSTAVAR